MISLHAISSKSFMLQIFSDSLFTRVITFDLGYQSARMHERLHIVCRL